MQLLNRSPLVRAQLTRSLHRATGLLRLLASHTRVGWRLSDLASHSGLDPATTHRLLRGLIDAGLACRVPDSRHYTLGHLTFELGLAAAPYFDLDRLTDDRLAALARELHGTIYLKLRSGVESVCVARHDGVGPVAALMLDVGGRRPLCLTAGGVAILIHLSSDEQAAIEADNRSTLLRQGAQRWSAAHGMLARSRALGYAANLGDLAQGICAIGVPVMARNTDPVASLTLARADTALAQPQADALARRLHEQAAEIASLLPSLRL